MVVLKVYHAIQSELENVKLGTVRRAQYGFIYRVAAEEPPSGSG